MKPLAAARSEPGDNATHIVGKEILATLVAGVLYPFGWLRSAHKTPRRKEQRTIVFIPGYLANKSSFLPLFAYLKAHGAKTILTYEYTANLGIDQAAIGLKQFLRRHVRGGRIDLVGHSLGGVIARVYLQELGGARRVDQCITLGTPHFGTYNAYWLTSRIGRELRPESAVLTRLAKAAALPASVRLLAVAGGSDNIVLPRAFAATAEDKISIPKLGHLGLLFAPQVLRIVANRLLPEPV